MHGKAGWWVAGAAALALAAVCAHVIAVPLLAVTVNAPRKPASAPSIYTVAPTLILGAETVAVTTLVLRDMALIVYRSM